MSSTAYLQINLIPILALIVVLSDLRTRATQVNNAPMLRRLAMIMISVLAVEAVCWMIDGEPGLAATVALWALNMLYFLLMFSACANWLAYVLVRLREDRSAPRSRRIDPLYALPLFVGIAMLAAAPFTDTFFTIDRDNHYCQGSLIVVQQIICMGYLVIASVLAMLRRREKESSGERREYALLALFTAFPLVGATMQIVYFGTSFIWPFSAAAFIMFYINLQRGHTTLDMMTGLHNRRALDEYLRAQFSLPAREGESLYVVVTDIDFFKQVNDRFGHSEGDRVICRVGEALKESFDHTDAFLARQGGDEFAAVLSGTDEQVIACVNELHAAAAADSGLSAANEWRLSLSVGWARYDYDGSVTPEQLMSTADERMYQSKQATKAAVAATSRL